MDIATALERTTDTAFGMRDLLASLLDNVDSRDCRQISPNVHAFNLGSVCMEITRDDSVPVRKIVSIKWHDHDWNDGDHVLTFA